MRSPSRGINSAFLNCVTSFASGPEHHKLFRRALKQIYRALQLHPVESQANTLNNSLGSINMFWGKRRKKGNTSCCLYCLFFSV